MRIFVIAGEASGDRLGAAFMAGMKELVADAEFTGVGGVEMKRHGFQTMFPMDELSVMGIAEVLPKYRSLKARIRQCADAILADPPDFVLTIDSPDFCLRVARIVKDRAPQIRTVHYVAPSVWAWRPARAAKMAKVIDQVLCLLPFEPPLMEVDGMRADFVGHPVVADTQATQEEAEAFRREHGISKDTPLVLALPGSRKGEIGRLAGTFGQVLQRVKDAHPEVRVVVPTTAEVAGLLEGSVAQWPGDPIFLDPRTSSFEDHTAAKRAAFRAADAALAASGTVSLELAAAGTPMVIAYDMNWLSRTIISRMLKIDTVTLVNLVSDTRSVPEFLGANCRPELIAPAMIDLLSQDGSQQEALSVTMERLGVHDIAPGLRAAKAVLNRLS